MCVNGKSSSGSVLFSRNLDPSCFSHRPQMKNSSWAKKKSIAQSMSSLFFCLFVFSPRYDSPSSDWWVGGCHVMWLGDDVILWWRPAHAKIVPVSTGAKTMMK